VALCVLPLVQDSHDLKAVCIVQKVHHVRAAGVLLKTVLHLDRTTVLFALRQPFNGCNKVPVVAVRLLC
jgi:hypothetical protein